MGICARQSEVPVDLVGIARGAIAFVFAAGMAVRACAGEFAFADLYFETIGDRDTIPSGAITALAQDSRGLFWIGTLSGLIRYDGYHFRRFKSAAADDHSLNGNNIRAIQPEPDGGLWIACEDQGIAHYVPEDEHFERFLHRSDDSSSLASNAVLGLARDTQGGLWAGTVSNGLDYLAPGSHAFRHFPVSESADGLHVKTVRRLLIDSRGDLWIAGIGGLDRLRAGTSTFEHIATDTADPDRLAGHYVYTLFEAHDGKLWLGLQDDGAAVLDPQTLALTRLRANRDDANALSHPWIDAIAEPRNGEIWLASFGGGIDIFDVAGNRVTRRIHPNLAVAGTLAVDRVTQLLSDRSGLLWIGTWGGGLQRHNATGSAFQTLHFDPTRPGLLSHATILSALEMPDGHIWLGTGGRGIDVLDRERGVVDHFAPDQQRSGALRDGIVLGLARARDGAVWVGTQQAGLYRYLGAAGFSSVEGVPKRFRYMLASRAGTLLAGTDSGLYEVDATGTHVTALQGADGAPLNQAVWALAEDDTGNLWVGTPFGLFQRPAGQTTLARIQAATAPPLLDVQSLLVDHHGQLWLATSAGVERLLRVEGDRGYFEAFPNFAAPVARLLADAQDRLWSERYVLDPQQHSIYEYGRADGVDIGNPTEIGHGATTHDGLLLFGGTNGLAIIDPARFAHWSYAPPLAISMVQIDGAARTPGPESLRLVPGEKQLSVEFAALDYSAPERNRYRYRLEGYDERWVDVDAAHRVASFTNLEPGGYLLHVQGSNRSGVFSTHEVNLPITVVPAFWQTNLFRAAAVLLLLGITWPIYRARLAVLKARQHQLEAVVEQRTAEIRQAHDQLETAYVQIEQLSRTDTLTGVGNRRSIERRLPVLLAQVDAAGGAETTRLAFLLLDLDRFKAINDVHGHAVGDAVLRELGSLLRRHENADVLATRWGGEEFLVVARIADEAAALACADRLRAEIATLRIAFGEGENLAFTASIGFACYPFDAAQPQRLPWERVVELADQALYAAKRAGRNCVRGVRPARALDPDFETRLRATPASLFDSGELQLLQPLR